MKVLITKSLNEEAKKLLGTNNIFFEERNFIDIKKNKTTALAYNQAVENSKRPVQVILSSPNAWSEQLNFESKVIERIYCIGHRLFDQLLDQNLDIPIVNAGNARELLDLFQLSKSHSYFYLCGSSRLETIPNFFHANELDYTEFHAYDTLENPQKLDANFDYVLFFSPSAVRSYFKNNDLKNSIPIALGNTTARALDQFGHNAYVAKDTNQLSMIECLLNLIRKRENGA